MSVSSKRVSTLWLINNADDMVTPIENRAPFDDMANAFVKRSLGYSVRNRIPGGFDNGRV
jgi:hypothetical protein